MNKRRNFIDYGTISKCRRV